MRSIPTILALVCAIVLALAVKAQPVERQKNQQQRIGEGIENGTLNPGEAANLDKKAAGINHEIKADKAANDGELTPAERKQINNQQNKLSNQIYNDKHNGQGPVYGNNKVDQRRKMQQERIGEGVENGTLTAGQTAHLEKQESALNKEVRTDRKANGGSLTPAERKQVNQQQNKLSREIYRKKHT